MRPLEQAAELEAVGDAIWGGFQLASSGQTHTCTRAWRCARSSFVLFFNWGGGGVGLGAAQVSPVRLCMCIYTTYTSYVCTYVHAQVRALSLGTLTYRRTVLQLKLVFVPVVSERTTSADAEVQSGLRNDVYFCVLSP